MEENDKKEICGIVMPISAIDNCSETHWAEVKSIISDAAVHAGFDPVLVSDADEIGIIQKRIIENLYDNPVVVCDVSAKNPNVMFELGMRLAFDKPTIIIKDDATSYSFDTSSIEHLEYPRDLRFAKILDFKAKLSSKIRATYQASIKDESYTTFLKHFGEFKVAKIDKKEVTPSEFIIEELRSIRRSVSRLEGARSNSVLSSKALEVSSSVFKNSLAGRGGLINFEVEVGSYEVAKKILNEVSYHPEVVSARINKSRDKALIVVRISAEGDSDKTVSDLVEMIKTYEAKFSE
ncbi:hypothetical protein [uncultured Pseudomonas sp.]|uniref:hypothetical protein n=1 Tax=uncultured Pseudomonas sp. TaxID=114707 RepID=UPI002582BA6B|nr:hypothetical protein [uncultured Pseudomonas sp.]